MDSSLISNTSHVILYRTASTAFSTIVTNSNTSYVILYLILSEGMRTLLIFKYILCYSLSYSRHVLPVTTQIQIHLMLFFIALCAAVASSAAYSNTSYVILYRSSDMASTFAQLFKYILCYSLSELSGTVDEANSNSNTSYVILYHYLYSQLSILELYSNTSYVILYPTHFHLFLH